MYQIKVYNQIVFSTDKIGEFYRMRTMLDKSNWSKFIN